MNIEVQSKKHIDYIYRNDAHIFPVRDFNTPSKTDAGTGTRFRN